MTQSHAVVWSGILATILVGSVACGPGGGGAGGSSPSTHASTGEGGHGNQQTGGAGGTGGGSTNPTSSTSGSTSSDTGDGGCASSCTVATDRCAGSQVQHCAKGADGCATWTAPASCPANETCIGNQCVLSCSDTCVKDAKQCNTGKLQSCDIQANGCTDWSAATACATGTTCSGGKCTTACTDQCTVGNSQCSGTQTQTCSKQVNGCTDWDAAISCTALHDACLLSTGKCATVCTDACTLNDTKCASGQVQTCGTQTNGCTAWSAATDCPATETCTGTKCAAVACTANAKRCNGTVLESCDGTAWTTQQVCGQGCDATAKTCMTATTCTASTWRCSGNQAEICNSTGTAWLGVQSCAVGCSAGLCTGACTALAKRCNGMVPETCNTAGSAWTAGTACSTYCTAGTCADPSLTLNAVGNATLDDEHFYDGDVIIKSGSTLTVPTGKLIVHAKSFVLEAGSQIVVSPTGNDPRGKGAAAGSMICYTTSGNNPASLNVGATGGTFATVAQPIPPYSGYSCFSTETAYAAADTEFASGAAGGDCGTVIGGLGGGLLVIYADTIDIQGLISANGAPGSGCGAGGSGGLVALVAKSNLNFPPPGSISVMGAAGGTGGASAGGKGVVKLLYGDANTVTGTISGTSFKSYIPPLDISSSTHPNPTRWYNDNFPSLEVAWSKPFSTSTGYYYGISSGLYSVPSPTWGTVLVAEAKLFAPTSFAAGVAYLHVTTISPPANVGTVQGRFKVMVNSTAPTISSASHPSSTTWYSTNFSPYLSWTLPNADADVANLYWVFDSFAATIPTKAANKIPMNLTTPANSKTLLLTNQPAGIWYFHLITEDTMGYLTKTAAHYRVQLGPDPGMGSLSGLVKDAATGAPIQGASITLNRGVLPAAGTTLLTNAQGSYSFVSNVPAQQYELRVSMSGYADAVSTINVTKAMTTTVNVSMTH